MTLFVIFLYSLVDHNAMAHTVGCYDTCYDPHHVSYAAARESEQ